MRARPLTPAQITGALRPQASGVHRIPTTTQEGPAMPPSRPPASTHSRITNLARIVPANGKPASFWVANLTVNEVTVRVHNRFGSWVIDRGVDGLRDLPASYAADLQDAVRAAERAEQRQAVIA